MIGTDPEERFTFRGSPDVPLPLSSHEPPPSVTLKKSPAETRPRSEAPSTAWTEKRTRRGNRALKNNMYETRSRTHFSRSECAFIDGLTQTTQHPGANVLVAWAGELIPRVDRNTIFRPPQAVSHVQATQLRFSALPWLQQTLGDSEPLTTCSKNL